MEKEVFETDLTKLKPEMRDLISEKQNRKIDAEVAEANATSISDQMDPQVKARSFVFQWAKEKAETKDFAFSQVKVVWFAKTLQNWKAIVAIIGTPDHLLFEVIYNGDKKETYLDAYAKVDNVRISD